MWRILPVTSWGHTLEHYVAPPTDIPLEGREDELRVVYSQGNSGQTKILFGPEHVGYPPSETGWEYLAEALRAYMANPNYFKTVAPKTAARIREWVNTHPRISKIIQFNGLVGGGVGIEAAAQQSGIELVPVDHDPFAAPASAAQ